MKSDCFITQTSLDKYFPIGGYFAWTGNPADFADLILSSSFITSSTPVLTIEMWLRVRSNVGEGMFFGFNTYDVYRNGTLLGYNTAVGDIYGMSSIQTSETEILSNKWKHFVCVMNQTTSYTNNKIYIDGEEVSISQILGSENAGNRSFNNGSMRINGWLLSGGLQNDMDLSIFRVYKKELTQQEVLQNYNAERPRFEQSAYVENGLVLHLDTSVVESYPGTGNIWYDLSPNGNNCTLFGSPTFTTALGGQFIFDGSSTKYGVVGDDSSIKPTNEITISMVLSSNHTGNDARSAIMRGFFGDGYGMLHVNQGLTFYINSWNSFFNGRAVDISPYGPFTLRNIVGVYDGTNLKIYENGVLVATGVSFSGPIQYPIGFNLEIARSPGSDGNGNHYWNGSISQILIYNRGLTAQEVQENYNEIKKSFAI